MPPSYEIQLLERERPVERVALAAVVAREDHERVALEPRAPQRGEHAADTVVHAAHHRGVSAERAAVRHRARRRDPCDRRRAVGRPFPRRVRRRVVQAQSRTASLRCARDVLDGAIAEQVRQVAVGRDARLVLPEIRQRVFARVGRDVREVVERAAQAAEELVEAVAVRADTRAASRGATCRSAPCRSRPRASASRSSAARPAGRPAATRAVSGSSRPTVETLRVSPRDECAARRRANRRGRVRARELHALRRRADRGPASRSRGGRSSSSRRSPDRRPG